jgi:hypothetical protein
MLEVVNFFGRYMSPRIMQATGASSALKAMPYDVVVWSNGPNETNELGKGDDIVLVPYVGRSE